MPALFCPALLRHFKWLFLVCVLFCLTMEEIEVLQAFSFLYKSFAAFSSQYLEKSRYPVSCQAHWGGGWKRSRPTLGLSTPFQIDLQIGCRLKMRLDTQEHHNTVHYSLLSLILQLEFIFCLIHNFTSCMVSIIRCSRVQKGVTMQALGPACLGYKTYCVTWCKIFNIPEL